MSTLSNDDSYERIAGLVHDAIGWALAPAIPAFVGGFLLAEELLRYVFGAEYTVAAIVLVVLLLETVVQSAHEVIGHCLMGVDKPNLAARATIVTLVLNIGLNVALIPQYGILGAAIATTVSFTTNAVLHGIYLNRTVPVRLPVRMILWFIAAAATMGLVIAYVGNMVTISSLPELLVVVGVGVVVYSVTAGFSPRLRASITEHR